MNFRNRPIGQVNAVNGSEKSHEDSGVSSSIAFSKTLKGVTGESSALLALLKTAPRPLERFFHAVSILSRVGFSFIFEGVGSRLVARETALKLDAGEKRELFIRPGTVDAPELSRHFFSKNSSFTLVIHSFNIAPLSVYGPDLIDICISKQLTPDLFGSKTIIFTPDESGVSLDIPSSLMNALIRMRVSDLEISSSSSVDELITEMEANAGLSAEIQRLFSEMISRLRDIEGEQEKSVVELAYFLVLKGCIGRFT